jgi:hypothetical protein
MVINFRRFFARRYFRGAALRTPRDLTPPAYLRDSAR